MSRDIKCVRWDHTHTHYSFPVRVIRRTNSTITPPAAVPRPRDLDHRNQRVEEHIVSREQSGATARGRLTLELVWPTLLAS